MPDSGQFHVDNVLTALGPTGKYQLMLAVVACLTSVPSTYQLLGNVFLGGEVPHQCAPLHNTSDVFEELQGVHNVSVEYQQCRIIVQSNGTVYRESSCLYGYHYPLPRDRSVLSEFDLVCERKSLFSLSQTLVFAGQGVGSLLGTIISDRYGRKVTIVGANVAMLLVGLAIAYAPNYFVFAGFKFLAGVMQQAMYVAKCVFLVELIPAKQRRLASAFGGLSWALSAVTMALVGYLMRNSSWRMTQVAFTMSSALVVLQIWLLDESIRWLVANGKAKVAEACVKRAARWNKKTFEEVLKAGYAEDGGEGAESTVRLVKAQEAEKTADDVIAATKSEKLTLLDILRVRRFFFNALIMWTAWFTAAVGYFTLYLTGSTLSGDTYLNFFLLTLMEIPAGIILYFGFNRIGRRPTTIALYTTLGTGLLAIGIFRHLSHEEGDVFGTLTIVATLYALVGGGGCFIGIFFYMPEFFPTNVRNQATGVASAMARLGAMLAPFTGIMMEIAVWLPGLVIGLLASLVACAVTALPETRGRELPQTLDDLKAWYEEDKKKKSDNKLINETETAA